MEICEDRETGRIYLMIGTN